MTVVVHKGASAMQKRYNVDFLRCLFCTILVVFHIVHGTIQKYSANNTIYNSLYEKMDWASLLVQCFLIIGGFFLYESYEK